METAFTWLLVMDAFAVSCLVAAGLLRLARLWFDR